VTLLNLPGFHGSAPIEASLSAYVSWIGEALDAFGVRSNAILLGNGFGGTLALAFALDHPDRLSWLVICDAAPGFPEPGKQAFRTMAEKVAEGGMGAIAEVAANRVFHAGFLEDHPVAIEERRAILLEVDPQAFRAACRILMEADLLSRLGGLKVPTLVICGALDQATPPPLNRAIAEGVPGARYIEIPACGHCPPLENPQEFLRAFESLPEG
jgi:pimeloyl-ACP methyl ester carboxylesterase